MEGRVDDLDLPQVDHHPQGGVIAPAAIVLDDRRLVLVTGAAREAAALQSTGQRINRMMEQRRPGRPVYGGDEKDQRIQAPDDILTGLLILYNRKYVL